MRLSWVPAGNVIQVWPDIAEDMDKACRRNGCPYTASYLLKEAQADRAVVFIVANGERASAGLVGRMERRPDGVKIFNILALCGREMIEVLQDEKNWPDLDCEKYVFVGGDAYMRLFPKAKIICHTFEMEVG